MKKHLLKNEQEPLVEIIDNQGQTLLYMPLEMAMKKRLTRAIVVVIVQNSQKKILLQKHNQNHKYYKDLWDISIYGNVYATEAFEDAARRELKEQLNLNIAQIYPITTLPYTNGQNAPLLATVYITPPSSLAPQIDRSRFADSMFVDIYELKALVQHSPELFTPELIWASQANWLK